MTAHFQKSSDVISGIVDYTPQESVYRSYVKRIFDIGFVLASALVVLPVTLILALLVMTDGHSPFYTQERVGRDGKVVGRYAPTTKPEDIEKDIEKLL